MATVTNSPQRLGDVLVARGYLTEEQVLAALSAQQAGGRSKLLGEVIVEQGAFRARRRTVERGRDQLPIGPAGVVGAGFVASIHVVTVDPRDRLVPTAH